MKSQVNALLHVMSGLCKDVQTAYPALKWLDRDLANLTLQCQTRGITLFTLDLLNLDKLLLAGLDTGFLQLSGPFSRRISERVRVPRLFGGLWLKVFDAQACLKPDADETAVLFLRSLCGIGKRILMDCSPSRVQATMENYHDIERELRPPTLGWEFDDSICRSGQPSLHLGDCVDTGWETLPLFAKASKVDAYQTEVDRRLLDKVQTVADLIVGSFSPMSPLSLSGELEAQGKGIGFRHGRGAVAERLKNRDKSSFPNWPAKLEKIFPWGLCGSTVGSPLDRPSNHEVASRIMTVPKTAKSPRLIASEPTAHMWCQQLILNWFETQFKSLFEGSFIDLNSQWKSGDMVLKSSLDRLHATVDLSDASDRVTCWTVERIFRRSPDLLNSLHAARTRYFRDNVSDVPSFLKPKKFASQGTAVTFPVMSFVMLCLALGACIDGKVTWQKIRRLRNDVRIYGDDIIIPTDRYARLMRAMVLVQLKVNMAKSYVNGQFRESCGVDGFKGVDVTPVRPTTLVADSPASCQAVVDTSNNLFNKGLWNAAYSTQDLLPRHVQNTLRIVGQRDAGFSGLSSFVGSDERHLRRRWNHRYQRYEVLVWGLRSKQVKRDRDGFSALLDFFASRYSSTEPRVVSRSAEKLVARGSHQWEPHNTGGNWTRPDIQDARLHDARRNDRTSRSGSDCHL